MFSLKLSPSATAATDPAVTRDFDRSFSSSQEEEGKQPAWRSVWGDEMRGGKREQVMFGSN
jgi:hypothetical protein